MSIICNATSVEHNLFESHARRSHAKIDNSIDIEFTEYGDGLYSSALTVESSHSYYKVFISHELTIIYNGNDYYGQTPTYNAILWEITDNILDCKKVVPVLTIEECQSTEGTFYYDGSYVYVHPFGSTIENKTYKRLNLDAKQILFNIKNSKNIFIQGVDIAFAPYIDLHTNILSKTTFRDCVFSFTCYSSACQIVNSDIDFYSCIATHAANDGWGVSGYGNCSLYNCDAIHCYDDGVSHHDSTIGIIDGGTWSYNGKGGITPSFGSKVNVQNAVCHHNKYGCYYLASVDRITNAQVLLQNVLMYDNTAKDLKVGGYYVISHNCQYGTKEIDASGTIDEYGNSVN